MIEDAIQSEKYAAACREGWAADDLVIAAKEKKRPFMLLRPRMFREGNQWCALYGENLQEGVAGFGDSPEEAALSFDSEWIKKI